MKLRTVFALMVLLTVPLTAQKSDAADSRAGSWFNTDDETFSRRTAKLMDADMNAWVDATKANVVFKHDDLYSVMTAFDPLWNDDDQIVKGAVAKYAKRLQQLPVKAVEEWGMLTDADPVFAATSLVAENDLFPHEKFNEKAFQALKTKYK